MKIVYIIIGCALCALSYTLFLIPHQIVPGGVGGIAMVLHFLYKTPVGIVTIILNIPLFIIAIRVLGIGYGVKSIAAILLTNIMIDFAVYTLKIPSPTNNFIPIGPLFIIAIRVLGIGYGVKSIAAILLTNIMIDFAVYTLKIPSPTNNFI